MLRNLQVFGYTDQHGHGEVDLDHVRVPASNVLGEEGAGFALSQARLGPGRIHHCMRTIGVAERALELMVDRALTRRAFGGPIADQGVVANWLAESRLEIEQARLLCLKAAWLMDTAGNRAAHTEIAAIKVVAARLTSNVADRAIQGLRRRGRLPGHAARPLPHRRAPAAHRRRSRRGPSSDSRPQLAQARKDATGCPAPRSIERKWRGERTLPPSRRGRGRAKERMIGEVPERREPRHRAVHPQALAPQLVRAVRRALFSVSMAVPNCPFDTAVGSNGRAGSVSASRSRSLSARGRVSRRTGRRAAVGTTSID